jgi:hypothetical protein
VTQEYKNIFGDTSASVPSEIVLRSSLIMYTFFVCNIFLLLHDLLTIHWKLLSE